MKCSPNARAMAQVLNDPRVHDRLASKGLVVPAETVVVGGYHDTCDDSVIFFDLDRLPESHRGEFDTARRAIKATCERNAHERCRRFMSAPLTLSFHAARGHVVGVLGGQLADDRRIEILRAPQQLDLAETRRGVEIGRGVGEQRPVGGDAEGSGGLAPDEPRAGHHVALAPDE